MAGRVVAELLRELGVVGRVIQGIQILCEVGERVRKGQAIGRNDVDGIDVESELELMPPAAIAQVIDEVELALVVILIGGRVGTDRRHT